MMLHYDTTARVWTAYEGSWIDDPDAGLARTFRARQPVFRTEEDMLGQERTNWQMNQNASAAVESDQIPEPDWQGALSCETQNILRVGALTMHTG